MSAPTLWEEGRMSGSRVTRLSILLGLLLLAADLGIHRHLTLVLDGGFVALCLGAALAVRPDDFFRVAVLPPLLLVGLLAVVALVHRAWVGRAGDSLLQALVSGLAHHAGGLMAGYLVALGVLGIRQRVLVRARRQARARAHHRRDGEVTPPRSASDHPLPRG